MASCVLRIYIYAYVIFPFKWSILRNLIQTFIKLLDFIIIQFDEITTDMYPYFY
jgi:hypothetical protein